MRKYVLGVVLSTISLAGVAQSNSLGINAGFGHSWIKNHQDVQFNPAGNFGVSFVHSTKTNFGFGADLKFSLEGGQEETVSTPKVEHTTDLNYIRVPLKAIYFFGNYGQRLRPKVHVGPSLGFLVGAHDERKNTATGAITEDRKSDDDYHNFDIGLQGGVGFNYRLVKNTWFTTDLNYYNGFKGIRQPLVGSNSPRYVNNNVALNIGVNWGIGK
ncbi:MAG TPA: porin family protein [Segetibacter sp.]|jgi:hypothetical protein